MADPGRSTGARTRPEGSATAGSRLRDPAVIATFALAVLVSMGWQAVSAQYLRDGYLSRTTIGAALGFVTVIAVVVVALRRYNASRPGRSSGGSD